MAKRLARDDKAMLQDLVSRYSPELIARTATRMTPTPRRPGRPYDKLMAVCIWAVVEVWRKRSSKPLTVKHACELIANKYTNSGPRNPITGARLRNHYYSIKRLRRSPEFAQGTDRMLETLDKGTPPGMFPYPWLPSLKDPPGGNV